jgi:hypothetical protein
VLGVNWPEHEADHLSLSSAVGKNVLSCTTTPLSIIYRRLLNEEKKNFTFYFHTVSFFVQSNSAEKSHKWHKTVNIMKSTTNNFVYTQNKLVICIFFAFLDLSDETIFYLVARINNAVL